MRTEFLLALAIAASAISLCAQEAAPLKAMPYSPSLDVTSLDKSVDPCVDFYQFSCGGWIKNNSVPPDHSSWTVYTKLANDNQQLLWGILETDAKLKTRTTVQQKVGDYFASCMNTVAIDAAGMSVVDSYLASINALGDRKSIIAALADMHHSLPGSYFFGSSTGQDAIDSSTVIVALRLGGLGLPDRDYYIKTDEKTVSIRDQYVSFIQRLLTLSGESVAAAKGDAASIVRIETALAESSLTNVQLRDPHNSYNMMPMSDLKRLAPSIDWTAYFKTQGAPNVARLNVGLLRFIKAVQAELTNEPVPDLRAYLRFHLLAAVAPNLGQRFAQASFDFYFHVLQGTPVMPPRWKTCTREVDRELGEALGQEFIARTFTANTKAKTLLMTEQVETAMQHEIEEIEWMSPVTKQEALRKLHTIRNKIGYPDHWRDYSSLEVRPDDYFGNVLRAYRFERARKWNKLGKPVDLSEWGYTAPTVDAYFDAHLNAINFPAGILQPPLYDPSEDDAPNYGNTGATIGHELTHAFDDIGRQFDSEGNLRDWWAPADAKGFEDRMNCIRDQYATFTVVDDIKINSKLSSGEDLADMSGTLLAYIAWKKQTEGQVLSNADGFTPDQRFFVGMAQWACENRRPEDLRLSAVTNDHSPNNARVNGVVSNLPEFQKAFGCKANQPMVHTPTCRVW